MSTTGARPRRDLSKYQGRKLLWLLILVAVPSSVLYLAIAFSVVAAERQTTPERSASLLTASGYSMFAFAVVQLAAAWLIYRGWARPASSKTRAALAFVSVVVLCTCLSAVCAVMLEAFGFAILARAVRAGAVANQ